MRNGIWYWTRGQWPYRPAARERAMSNRPMVQHVPRNVDFWIVVLAKVKHHTIVLTKVKHHTPSIPHYRASVSHWPAGFAAGKNWQNYQNFEGVILNKYILPYLRRNYSKNNHVHISMLCILALDLAYALSKLFQHIYLHSAYLLRRVIWPRDGYLLSCLSSPSQWYYNRDRL